MNIFNKKRQLSSPSDGHQTVSPETGKLERFTFPDRFASMGDHLARAESESGPFDYVTISSRSDETKNSLLKRLGLTKASFNHEKMMNLNDIPFLHLEDRVVSLKIKDCIPVGLLDTRKFKYICLAEIIFIFTPTQSFNTEFAAVNFSISDERLLRNTEVRSITSPSNVGMAGIMGLDHSIAIKDLDHLSFRINIGNSPFTRGTTWGAMQFLVKIKATDFPISVSFMPTSAMLLMPDTAFMKSTVNPCHVSLMFDNYDLGGMRDLHKEGRIVDHTVPMNAQGKILASQSEAGSVDENKPVTGVENWKKKQAREAISFKEPLAVNNEVSSVASPSNASTSHIEMDEETRENTAANSVKPERVVEKTPLFEVVHTPTTVKFAPIPEDDDLIM